MGSLAARRSPPPTAGGLTVLCRGGRALAPVLSLLIFIACGGGGQTPTTSVPPSPSVSPPPPLPPEIGSPCPGVMVRGEAPEHDDPVVRATLLIDWESGSVGSFDWAGPYHDDRPDEELSSLLEVNVAEWRVEILDGVTRHTLEIEWPPFLEASLQFRSGDGGCVLSVLACSATVCELRP